MRNLFVPSAEQHSTPKVVPQPEPAESPAGTPIGGDAGDLMSFDQFVAAFRRQFPSIMRFMLLGAVFGLGYGLFSRPIYSAYSNILLNPQIVSSDNDVESYALTSKSLDNAYVDSQLEIMKSGNVLSSISSTLNLIDDPRFDPKSPSPVGSILSMVLGSGDKAEQDFVREMGVRDNLRDNLFVDRLGDTYVLEVRYESPDPELAAAIANAFASAYISQQVEAKYAVARRTERELNDLLAETRHQASNANIELEKFRQENDIIMAGNVILQELQMIETTRALAEASAERTAIEARIDFVRSIMNDHISTIGTDTINNQIVSDLRAQYLTYSRQYEKTAEELGSEHPQALLLKEEMARVQKIISGEISRVLESYQIDFEVALTRERMLTAELEAAKQSVSERRANSVRLDDLTSETEMYRAQYESMLRRHQSAVQQQQSLSVSEARIISEAVRPLRPERPRKKLILILGVLAGAAFGAAVGFYRERIARTASRPGPGGRASHRRPDRRPDRRKRTAGRVRED
ncbi:MAG TPA: GumC family protein [Thermohalobaculum sp.]|nr:GumC family protein [Thermohalobaculum sp.]